MRVLVVDDSAVARQALSRVLEREGLEVLTAASAREASAAVDAGPPGGFDLMLMDLQLPDGSGIETFTDIKARSGWEDVPVVMVTGSDDGDDLRRAFAAGATDYLRKPASTVELMARVRAALRLKQEMDRRKAREHELTAAREALLGLNGRLERRVEEQVAEIVGRAREIEALNAQLRVQVQERSNQLAAALIRLSTSATAPLPPGTELGGRVRLERCLAAGGMGRVYAAEDLLTRTPVAVKLLHPRSGFGPTEMHRFLDEAAAAAAIHHPAVVRIIHVDISADGHPFLMMELVRGQALDAVLASGPLTPAAAVSVAAVVADALAAAHAAGVVHRDIKPANLTLCAQAPGVRVLDFGISKIRTSLMHGTLTETGMVLGTPVYMPPEQFQNSGAVTPAADVYSLGAVLFEMVAGTPPFKPADLPWLLSGAADAPSLGDVAPSAPDALCALTDRCLSSSASRRPTARRLADALNALGELLGSPAAERVLEERGHPTPHEPAVAAS